MDFKEVFFLMTNNTLKQQKVRFSQKQDINVFLNSDNLNDYNERTTLWFFQQEKTLL
ncbi:MAG: hypothetical protein WC278_03535 [Bacilli bacterium]|jgi:hypothetical protein|nr:hypothetical protein [Bacilli bacterium]MDD2682180.1 hypothetical protein [Bacilli bacterium]MDD3121738.1 hypothetical protein [Bacilli bacterium]MDD4063666.1 hypothetical protein [Bacilli bacterium]MDD4482530.1 hypothetical protein [Bacilli bacterium]